MKSFLRTALLWGFVLWLIGYILGIVLFAVVPPAMLGWVISPIGVAITLWVLFKKINFKEFKYFVKLGVVWTVMAMFLDYLFIVLLFAPEDGYYKPDVYLYYLLTLTLPLAVGWYKTLKKEK